MDSSGLAVQLSAYLRPIFPSSSGSVTRDSRRHLPMLQLCTATSFGRVRILNASTGYQPFYVYLGSWMLSGLGNRGCNGLRQSASGTQTVTRVSGSQRLCVHQKTVQVRASASMTIAIINTANGLDIMEISDISCSTRLPAPAVCGLRPVL